MAAKFRLPRAPFVRRLCLGRQGSAQRSAARRSSRPTTPRRCAGCIRARRFGPRGTSSGASAPPNVCGASTRFETVRVSLESPSSRPRLPVLLHRGRRRPDRNDLLARRFGAPLSSSLAFSASLEHLGHPREPAKERVPPCGTTRLRGPAIREDREVSMTSVPGGAADGGAVVPVPDRVIVVGEGSDRPRSQ